MLTHGQNIREITRQVSNQWQIGKPFNTRESMQQITLRVVVRRRYRFESFLGVNGKLLIEYEVRK